MLLVVRNATWDWNWAWKGDETKKTREVDINSQTNKWIQYISPSPIVSMCLCPHDVLMSVFVSLCVYAQVRSRTCGTWWTCWQGRSSRPSLPPLLRCCVPPPPCSTWDAPVGTCSPAYTWLAWGLNISMGYSLFTSPPLSHWASRVAQ